MSHHQDQHLIQESKIIAIKSSKIFIIIIFIFLRSQK